MGEHAATVEDRLRLLESSVRGIVIELDAHGRYLAVWTHDEELLARPREELLASTINEVLGVEGGAPFMELIRKILAERRPLRHEYQLKVLGGVRWFACEGVPGRHPDTVVFLIHDITVQKQIEAQLIESDRLASIGQLAGGVGHEINNPLAWMMTHLRTVQRELAARVKGGPDAELERWFAQLGQVLEGAERIRQIARDLSFFTHASEEAPPRPIDLRVALDWAADIATAELRYRAPLIKQYGEAPLVTSSEARLGQVFLNLLINTAHAIEPGQSESNEVRIELSTDERGNARVDIVDTGRGISSEHQKRLFEPFFTTKPRGSGTGLGLSVSRRIVQASSGSLDLVSSRPGETRFRVCLPPASPSLDTIVARTQTLPPPAQSERKLRVLVIDDQPHFLTSLCLAIADTFDVTAETSARSALARLRGGEPFDAIVCDMMMPDQTGMDMYDALVKDHSELVDRIVFMTGGVYTERARSFLTNVANPRIEKPFPPPTLEAMIFRLCDDSARPPAKETPPAKIIEASWGMLTPFVDEVLQKARNSTSLEEVSQALVRALYQRFSGSLVLARMFVTVTQDELSETDRTFVADLAASKGVALRPSTPILALIGSAGAQTEWNDRRTSRRHRCIPLISKAFIQQIPMMSRLLADLNVTVEGLDKPEADVGLVVQDWSGLFHIPDASTTKDQLGRLIIPAHDFVADFGVKTVFGTGGSYPDGRIAVMILFTKETVPPEIAKRFLPIVSQFKVATSAHVNGQLFRI